MLKNKFQEDLKLAMKSSDAMRVGVLRLLISALNNKAIDKKGKTGSEELTEEEALQVLMTESKKRKEAIEVFTKGNRTDLADKEKGELEIIQQYLPKQMSREEVEKSVEEIVKRVGSKEMGPVMKEVMKELKGKADSALVSQLVKEKLQ